MERRLSLISEMSPAVWVHLTCVLIALVLGAVVLMRRKGDGRHRLMGRIWVALMAVGALSSFAITEIREGFSPIHLLSAYTLLSLIGGVVAIRRGGPGAVEAHRRWMQSLYASGLLIAGAFTFLPFRLLGRLTLGEVVPWANIAFVVVMASAGLWLLLRMTRDGAGHSDR